MTSEKKIFEVLNKIKIGCEISPDENWMEFKLNTELIEEDSAILLKLRLEKVIELEFEVPFGEEGPYSVYTTEELMIINEVIWVKKLSNFNKIYRKYKVYDLKDVLLKITNPFWLVWKILLFIIDFFSNNKIVSIIFFILTLVTIDYSMAW